LKKCVKSSQKIFKVTNRSLLMMIVKDKQNNNSVKYRLLLFFIIRKCSWIKFLFWHFSQPVWRMKSGDKIHLKRKRKEILKNDKNLLFLNRQRYCFLSHFLTMPNFCHIFIATKSFYFIICEYLLLLLQILLIV
jgi:hypothetical protein